MKEFTIVNDVPVSPTLPQSHAQRSGHHFNGTGSHQVLADDEAGEHVNDESDIHEPRPGATVGEVRDPDPVWSRGGEVSGSLGPRPEHRPWWGWWFGGFGLSPHRISLYHPSVGALFPH